MNEVWNKFMSSSILKFFLGTLNEVTCCKYTSPTKHQMKGSCHMPHLPYVSWAHSLYKEIKNMSLEINVQCGKYIPFFIGLAMVYLENMHLKFTFISYNI